MSNELINAFSGEDRVASEDLVSLNIGIKKRTVTIISLLHFLKNRLLISNRFILESLCPFSLPF